MHNEPSGAPRGWARCVLPPATLERLKRTIALFDDDSPQAPRSLLLVGAPGTGKTEIARAIADETRSTFEAVSLSDLKAPYIGQSTQQVRNLFERARAREATILFIDEFDYVVERRDLADSAASEIVTQLLVELDAVGRGDGRILLIGAAYGTERIDPAVLARIGAQLEIPMPDAAARVAILRNELERVPCASDLDVGRVAASIATRLDGASGRDISSLVRRAVERAFETADAAEDLHVTEAALLAEADAFIRRRPPEPPAAPVADQYDPPQVVTPIATSPPPTATDPRGQRLADLERDGAPRTPLEKFVALLKRLFVNPT
jgi:SpoVK/Ycf46/Vps4 family AAA+-type ATPase